MPVSTTRERPARAYTAATERNSTSTAGRHEFSGGSWFELDPRRCVPRRARPSCGGRRARSTPAPGSRTSPSRRLATRGCGHRVARRSASSLVNTGGMCCTMTIGTGRFARAGSGSSAASAFGPPVETPIASTSIAARPAGAPEGHASAGRNRGAGSAAGRCRHARAAERLDLRDELRRGPPASPRHAADVGRLRDVVGRARAPARRAWLAAPRSVSVLNMITGSSGYVLADLAQRLDAVQLGHLDVERDDVRGELRHLLRARSCPLRRCRRPRAPGRPPRTSVRRRRTTTESSTIRTRILRMSRAPTPSSVSFSMSASSVNGFMRYSLAPAASASHDLMRSRSRW